MDKNNVPREKREKEKRNKEKSTKSTRVVFRKVMREIKRNITSFFYLILLLIVTGCEHDVNVTAQQNEEEPSDEKEKVKIEIFTRANSYSLPSTRAAEDEVGRTPWVLVFKGQGAGATFIEAAQAFEMVSKRYVLLTEQTDGSKYQLLILANPTDKFYYGNNSTECDFNESGFLSKLTPGVTTYGDACARLFTKPLSSLPLNILPYSGAQETIPMSYLLEVDKIDSTTKIANTDGTSLMLTRVLAKIAIVNQASNFTLKGVTAVMNVPRQGELHDADGVLMNNTTNLTEYRSDDSYSNALVTAGVVSGGQSTESTPIYMYESGTQNNTYLIIQGTFEGQDYYYKMVLVDSNVQYMDIKRNRYYTFTIKKAKGRGYDTVNDAKVAKPSNTDLDFELKVDDSSSYEIVANNDYYLGVSNSVFIAYHSTSPAADYNAFEVITDCTKDFSDARSITDNRAEADWAFSLIGPEKIPIVTSSTTNPVMTSVSVQITDWLKYYEEGINDRKNACITLKLGNLEKKVHIRQRSAIPTGGSTLKFMPDANTDPAGNEVSYFCLTGQVEEGTDSPKDWIRLYSSAMPDTHTGEERVIVEDGKIYIKVLPNATSKKRNGIVHLTTVASPNGVSVNAVQRIKLDITQE